MHTFYCPEIQSKSCRLTDAEAHHAVKVLRLNAQDKVRLVDGKGKEARGSIKALDRDEVIVSIDDIHEKGRDEQPLFSLAIAPTKQSDRMETLVEKCTEIGLRNFYPFISYNSERRRLRTDRLEKIALSAMKQSQRTWLPEIHELMKFNDFLELELPAKKYIAHCHADLERISIHEAFARLDEPVVVLIGPEGDFSKEEVSAAIDAGYRPISLGDMRLRTETAALFACVASSLAQ